MSVNNNSILEPKPLTPIDATERRVTAAMHQLPPHMRDRRTPSRFAISGADNLPCALDLAVKWQLLS